MKSSIRLIQCLLPILCIISAASAFVPRQTRLLAVQRHLQRENPALFQEPPTLEKETTLTKTAEEEVPEEEMSEADKLMKQVKEAGTAGIISYALWEWAFWCLSVRFRSFDKLIRITETQCSIDLN